MTIRTETAKKWGGTVTVALTGFLEIGKKYVIQDAEINGEKCVLIKEDKSNIKIEIMDKKNI